MTNEQLYLAIGIPMLFNAAMTGLLIAYFNARFATIERRFEGIDKRFDDIATCGAPSFIAWRKSWTRGLGTWKSASTRLAFTRM